MTDSGRFHVGLTPERVVDAAVDLTRESHLMSWSIRDLASRLGVADDELLLPTAPLLLPQAARAPVATAAPAIVRKFRREKFMR